MEITRYYCDRCETTEVKEDANNRISLNGIEDHEETLSGEVVLSDVIYDEEDSYRKLSMLCDQCKIRLLHKAIKKLQEKQTKGDIKDSEVEPDTFTITPIEGIVLD